MSDAAFGAFAPSPFAARARALALRLKPGPGAKLARSALYRLAGGKAHRPYDVSVFDTQKARLHPYDNICEKRVYAAPGLWDPEERAAIARLAAAGERGAPFCFVDVGANAGLYSLSARAAAQAAGRPIRILAIEPEETVRARLEFNFAASGVGPEEATILPWAATDAPRAVAIARGGVNRGETRIGAHGTQVPGRPLAEALTHARIDAVDALKIDIEGAEYPALSAFFRDAPVALRPRLIVIETKHEGAGPSALQLCLSNGYRETRRTRMNSILERA